MKILLATSLAIPAGGGIASYNQELVNLFGIDNQIHLLTDSDEKDVEGYVSTLSNYGKNNNDFQYCQSLIKKLNDENYDCIINSASSFIPVIAPFLKSPIIAVSHFVNGQLAINAGYNSRYISAIIALSNYGKTFIEDKFKIVDRQKVCVVYNFVKCSQILSTDSKLKHKPLKIVYPGGTSIAKSVDIVQQLVYLLIKSNLEFEFIWIGQTRLPSSKFSLFGLHNSYDLFPRDSRLKISGIIPRQQAEQIIGSANIFLLPSRGEGCPMTLLEAFRSGCIPVVSDAHHGSREILELSKTGCIVPQNSAKKLFDVIKDIIEHHEKYSFNYTKTQEFLFNYLSPHTWAENMNDIINSALKRERPIEPLTKTAFQKTANGYNRLLKIERCKSIIKSIKCRIKFDFFYFSFKMFK